MVTLARDLVPVFRHDLAVYKFASVGDLRVRAVWPVAAHVAVPTFIVLDLHPLEHPFHQHQPMQEEY